jgi:hypothetical protein
MDIGVSPVYEFPVQPNFFRLRRLAHEKLHKNDEIRKSFCVIIGLCVKLCVNAPNWFDQSMMTIMKLRRLRQNAPV